MLSTQVKEQKPIKCTLTRIIDDFNYSNVREQKYKNIVKNYVYIPEKKVIA